MPDFSKRSDDVEIMDDLACAGEVVNQTLREIENINRLLGGNYVTVDGVKKALGIGHRALGDVHGPQSTVHGAQSTVHSPRFKVMVQSRY